MSPAAPLLVLLGGFLGGVARFLLSGVVGRRIGETFPWGTLAVNVTGCLAIGLLAGFARTGGVFAGPGVDDFLVTGFCGGFTTVSSFTLQTLSLALDGERRQAVLNIVASTAVSLAAAAAGFRIALAIGS
jgi:CrcB protein